MFHRQLVWPLPLALCCLTVITLPKPVQAVEPAAPEGIRIALFDGSDLSHWRVMGCQAHVEDVLLVGAEGNGLVRSVSQYTDFVLEWKYRPRRAERWDAGVYFRCSDPDPGKPWPRRWQVNLKQGDEGNLVGASTPDCHHLLKPGQWNAMRLTVIGTKARLNINGHPAWEVDGIEVPQGYIGIQVEEPGGGVFEFKDVFITEVGHQPLFNGRDLQGWVAGTAANGQGSKPTECWDVQEGLLVCTGDKGPWLRSEQQFADFNLRLDYRLKPGGNSGVYLRVPADGNHHGPGSGVEIQILDDDAPRYQTLKAYQYTGSVYAIVAADPRVARPAGQWNTLEIDVHKYHYRIIHNGQVVVDADAQQHPELAERRLEGFLGLQNHRENVWFRNIRIKQ